MDVNGARRLKQLEDENRRLKHLVADLTVCTPIDQSWSRQPAGILKGP
jgi:hypothetical protein